MSAVRQARTYFLIEHGLSRKPLHTPHQVRGRLFPNHALPHRPLRLDLVLRHDKVAAALLGLIERAVAAVDHVLHGLAELELADADRPGDAGQLLAGGAADDLAVGDPAADAFGHGRADGEIRARKNRDQLLTAITGRE